MTRTKKVEVEVQICDYCDNELADDNNECGICNCAICENHKSEFDSEDGCICSECVKKGFEMGFNADGDYDANKIYFKGKRYTKEMYF
jgi:hypothetical protein